MSGSDLISNINLVLLSVYQYIEDYLNDSSWKDKYNLIIGGTNIENRKTVVEDIANQDDFTIGLPILTIITGSGFEINNELGNADGKESRVLRLQIQAKNMAQQNHLEETIRRLFKDAEITIYDYSKPNKPNVGTLIVDSVRVYPIYAWGDVNLGERFNSIVEIQSEYDGQLLAS